VLPWEQLERYLDTTGVVLFSGYRKFNFSTPERVPGGVYRDPGKLPCIFGLLRGMQTQNLNSIIVDAARSQFAISSQINSPTEKAASASADAVFRKVGLYDIRIFSMTCQ